MKQLNFNQMSELIGGDLSDNQKCLINGGVILVCTAAGFLCPAFWGAGVGASLIGMWNCL